MRILQIGATYVGAQEKIEYIIHRYLENRGHESFILYAYGTSNDARVIKYESKCTNIMRRILWKYLDRTPHAALLSTIQLLSKIEKIHPDIVHLHILHHGYIDYILLLKYLSRKKYQLFIRCMICGLLQEDATIIPKKFVVVICKIAQIVQRIRRNWIVIQQKHRITLIKKLIYLTI